MSERIPPDRPLDKYAGYFMVLPCNFKAGEKPVPDKPFLYISEKCPEDIKQDILRIWKKVKKETIKRHNEGEYSSLDYF